MGGGLVIPVLLMFAAPARAQTGDALMWARAKTCDDYLGFVALYKNSPYTAKARAKIAHMKCLVVLPQPSSKAGESRGLLSLDATRNLAVIGRDYRTLSVAPEDWNSYAPPFSCDNVSRVLPNGWHVASEERTQAIARRARFDTQVLVGESGVGFYTRQQTLDMAGLQFGSKLLIQEPGRNVRTTQCFISVLLERDGKESTPIETISGEVIFRP